MNKLNKKYLVIIIVLAISTVTLWVFAIINNKKQHAYLWWFNMMVEVYNETQQALECVYVLGHDDRCAEYMWD